MVVREVELTWTPSRPPPLVRCAASPTATGTSASAGRSGRGQPMLTTARSTPRRSARAGSTSSVIEKACPLAATMSASRAEVWAKGCHGSAYAAAPLTIRTFAITAPILRLGGGLQLGSASRWQTTRRCSWRSCTVAGPDHRRVGMEAWHDRVGDHPCCPLCMVVATATSSYCVATQLDAPLSLRFCGRSCSLGYHRPAAGRSQSPSAARTPLSPVSCAPCGPPAAPRARSECTRCT